MLPVVIDADAESPPWPEVGLDEDVREILDRQAARLVVADVLEQDLRVGRHAVARVVIRFGRRGCRVALLSHV